MHFQHERKEEDPYTVSSSAVIQSKEGIALYFFVEEDSLQTISLHSASNHGGKSSAGVQVTLFYIPSDSNIFFTPL